MAENNWQESGLTIVLLPSGDAGDSILAVAKRWTEMQLLAEAIWVRPEFLQSGSTTPPRQKAIVLGETHTGDPIEVEVDLFEQLARQQLLTVRLLVVKMVSETLEFDEDQQKMVDLLDRYISLALPLPVSAGNDREKYTTLLRLNLVTAPTEHQSDYGSLLINSSFHANFIASAEDRSAPLAGDAFVRHDESSGQFAAFTMMHVASIGALWSGLPVGLYELLNPSGSTGSQLYVSRAFVGAILTEGLARRASTRVLRRVADPAAGAVDFATELPVEGTYQISDSDRDSFVQTMVNLTFGFDDGKLSYQPSPEAERVRAVEQSLAAQGGSFFTFAWDKITSIPRHMIRGSRVKFATFLNRILHGDGDVGYATIRIPEEHLDVRDRVIMENRQRIAEEKERADLALVSPVTPSDVRSTPALWEDIRSLVFGMLDGSKLEKFGFSESENGWPIFYRVSDLFADPAAVNQVLESDGLLWDEEHHEGRSTTSSTAAIMKKMSEEILGLQAELDTELRKVVEGQETLGTIDTRLQEMREFMGASNLGHDSPGEAKREASDA